MMPKAPQLIEVLSSAENSFSVWQLFEMKGLFNYKPMLSQ
jgi:hypothetical protein